MSKCRENKGSICYELQAGVILRALLRKLQPTTRLSAEGGADTVVKYIGRSDSFRALPTAFCKT